MAEQSARMASLPAVLSTFGNDVMNAQAARMMPQSLQFQGFSAEFGGPAGPETLMMGNFSDEQKLRVAPLWVEQQGNNNCDELHSVENNSSVFSSEANSNMYGTSPQWLNYRYAEAEASFTSTIASMPQPLQGLKVEQEENKVELSHSVSSLYSHGGGGGGGGRGGEGPSHVSASPLFQKGTQMESTGINVNNVFGLFGSSNINLSSNNRSISKNCNVVEVQKNFKQANNHPHGESFNHMVNCQASTSVGGGFSLAGMKNLDHLVMVPRNEEWQCGQPKQLHSSSNNEDHLTKDFMGVGDDSLTRPLHSDELAKFNMQSQFHGHY